MDEEKKQEVKKLTKPNSFTFAWVGDVQGGRDSVSPAYIRALQSISATASEVVQLAVNENKI